MKRAELLDFLRANPNADSARTAAFFGIDLPAAASHLRHAFTRGYLTRTETRRQANGREVYGYSVVPGVEGLNKQERLAEASSNIARTYRGQSTARARAEPVLSAPDFDFTHSINTLAEGLAKQIAAQVVVALQGQLAKELAGVVPTPPVLEPTALDVQKLLPGKLVVAATKVRKPRIGILGLLPQQAGLIASEFGDCFDLAFWKEDGQAQLKSIGIGCELVLVTRFVSHSHTEVLKSIGANWRMVPGGMTELRDTLTNYYVEVTK